MPTARLSTRFFLLAICVVIAPQTKAHSASADAAAESLAWNADPWITLPLLPAALIYAGGIYRLWHVARHGAGVPVWRQTSFFAGLAALAVALLSPVDAMGEDLFSMHMVQHELLMLGAAPLIVAGRPLAVFIWAFPSGARKRIARAVKARAMRRCWLALSSPFIAWWLHAAILWAWHVPALFQAGLQNETVHNVQHASFLFSALLFWSALSGGRQRHGIAVPYILTTMIHTGILGALLTFSSGAWYPAYAGKTEQWGLTPLEDQQLGGLIMWVPAGLVFLIAGLAAAARMIAANREQAQQAAPRPESGL